jgi:hypothetical protein
MQHSKYSAPKKYAKKKKFHWAKSWFGIRTTPGTYPTGERFHLIPSLNGSAQRPCGHLPRQTALRWSDLRIREKEKPGASMSSGFSVGAPGHGFEIGKVTI